MSEFRGNYEEKQARQLIQNVRTLCDVISDKVTVDLAQEAV